MCTSCHDGVCTIQWSYWGIIAAGNHKDISCSFIFLPNQRYLSHKWPDRVRDTSPFADEWTTLLRNRSGSSRAAFRLIDLALAHKVCTQRCCRRRHRSRRRRRRWMRRQRFLAQILSHSLKGRDRHRAYFVESGVVWLQFASVGSSTAFVALFQRSGRDRNISNDWLRDSSYTVPL